MKRKKRKNIWDQAEGIQPRTEEAWGSFLEDQTMTSSVKVYHHRQFGYDLCSSPMLQTVPITELKHFPGNYKAKMVTKQEDVELIRSLYEIFIQDKNL